MKKILIGCLICLLSLWLSYSLGVQKGLKKALEFNHLTCPLPQQDKEIKTSPSYKIENKEEIKKDILREDTPGASPETINPDEKINQDETTSPPANNHEQSFTHLRGRPYKNVNEDKNGSSEESGNNINAGNQSYPNPTNNIRQPYPINEKALQEAYDYPPQNRQGPSSEINLDNVNFHIFSFTLDNFAQEFKAEFDDFIQKLGTQEKKNETYVFTIQMQDEEGAIYNVYKNDGYDYVSQFQSASLPQLDNQSFHAIDKKSFSADSKKIIIKSDTAPNIDFLYQAYLSDLHRQPAFASNDNYTLFKISPDLFILQHKI